MLQYKNILNNTRKYKFCSEDFNLQNKLIQASLLHVNKLGWNQLSISQGCLDLNISSGSNGLLSAYSVIEYLMEDWNNQALEKVQLKGSDFDKSEKVKDKIYWGIKERLLLQQPYLAKWNEAMALGAHPQNFNKTKNLLWNYSDEIWNLAGDRSLDYNYYTKRSLFIVIYASTELFMLSDQSQEYQQTWKFLERRIDDVLKTGNFINNYKSFFEATLSGIKYSAQAFQNVPKPNIENDLQEIRKKVFSNKETEKQN